MPQAEGGVQAWLSCSKGPVENNKVRLSPLKDSHLALKNDMNATVAWAIVTPALAAWPFISALPAFTLIGGPESVLSGIVALLLFATGFYGVAALGFFIAFASTDRARAARIRNSRGIGLKLGAYALAWTSVYFVLRFIFGV